ncbi:MAG TPA: hypothetical protein DCY13_06855 [Verrucomicrobiales bacterium]|nr:hypothetical protein [Verrucomicrobiales bacterium]
MKTGLRNPPLEPADDSGHVPQNRSYFWWFLALIVAAAGARIAVQWNTPMPACGFRTLTTVPCPFCGGTRALSAAAGFDWLLAIQFNPLVMLAAVLIVIWSMLGLADLLLKGSLVTRLNGWLARHHFWWTAAGLTLVNWGYLLLNPP